MTKKPAIVKGKRVFKLTALVVGGVVAVLGVFSVVGAVILNKAFGSLYNE